MLRLSLLTLMAACHAAPSDEPAQAAITHAAPDDGDPAVVAIVDDGGRAHCSGTLIAPRVVLTAAHCGSAKQLRSDLVFFGSTLAGGGLRVAISDVSIYPGWVSGQDSGDLALLFLAADPGVAPIALPTRALDDSLLGGPVRVVGFGTSAPNAQDQDTKRSGIAKLLSYDSTSFRFAPDPSQTCLADSGGPGLISVGGTEALFGVTHAGDTGCSAFGVDLRVDVALADFIAPYLAGVAPGAVSGLGERCLFSGHCAAGPCLAATDDPRIMYCSKTCSSAADCPAPLSSCSAGPDGTRACRLPEPSPGAVGAACEGDDDCLDECTSLVSTQGPVCARRCVPDGSSCGNQQQCTHVGGINFFCVRTQPGAAGCSVAVASRGTSALPLLLVGLHLILRRPRRSSAK